MMFTHFIEQESILIEAWSKEDDSEMVERLKLLLISLLS